MNIFQYLGINTEDKKQKKKKKKVQVDVQLACDSSVSAPVTPATPGQPPQLVPRHALLCSTPSTPTAPAPEAPAPSHHLLSVKIRRLDTSSSNGNPVPGTAAHMGIPSNIDFLLHAKHGTYSGERRATPLSYILIC